MDETSPQGGSRLAQEARERWHTGEDERLDRYVSASEEMDRRGVQMATLAARGWRVVGILGLAPAFVLAEPDAPGMAVALGGVALAYAALVRLTAGLASLSGAAIAWRQVPQFRENHVLTETLAFNLLLGRCWPPNQGDLEEAEEVCRRLGLGDLLDRMPAGLQQMVGESGWQLSHGERSRLFMARALLQGADVVVLDESFAALDPESLDRALGCVLERAPALLVIAHA